MTFRATSSGFFTRCSAATAPSRDSRLSITAASSSQKPSKLSTGPVPALKIGLSSSVTAVAHAASSAEPPPASTARPASAAAFIASTASCSEPGRQLPAPPCAMSAMGMLLLCVPQFDVQVAQLLLGDGARRLDHQVLAALRLRERDHVADLVHARHQRDEAIQAEGDAAVGRRAVRQRVEQEPELAPLLL